MKYLVKRNWTVDSGGIPVYQEACVYRAGESSTLPGLKRFEGDTRGFGQVQTSRNTHKKD